MVLACTVWLTDSGLMMFANNPSSEVSEKAIVNIRGYINNQDKMLSSQASDSMKVSKNATQGDM